MTTEERKEAARVWECRQVDTEEWQVCHPWPDNFQEGWRYRIRPAPEPAPLPCPCCGYAYHRACMSSTGNDRLCPMCECRWQEARRQPCPACAAFSAARNLLVTGPGGDLRITMDHPVYAVDGMVVVMTTDGGPRYTQQQHDNWQHALTAMQARAEAAEMMLRGTENARDDAQRLARAAEKRCASVAQDLRASFPACHPHSSIGIAIAMLEGRDHA